MNWERSFCSFSHFLGSEEQEYIHIYREKCMKKHPGYQDRYAFLYNLDLPLNATRKEETAAKYHRRAKIRL